MFQTRGYLPSGGMSRFNGQDFFLVALEKVACSTTDVLGGVTKRSGRCRQSGGCITARGPDLFSGRTVQRDGGFSFSGFGGMAGEGTYVCRMSQNP